MKHVSMLKNQKGLSSAIVVILLTAVGLVIATIAIKFFTHAAVEVNKTAHSELTQALEEIKR